jgi:hypothetical protein
VYFALRAEYDRRPGCGQQPVDEEGEKGLLRTMNSRLVLVLTLTACAFTWGVSEAAAQAVDDQYLEEIPGGGGSLFPSGGGGDGGAATRDLPADAKERLRKGASKEEASKLEALATSAEYGAPSKRLLGPDLGQESPLLGDNGRLIGLFAVLVGIAAAVLAGATLRRRRRPA